MGRKREHPDNATKQREYRSRKKATDNGETTCRAANRHYAYNEARPCPICGYPASTS